MSTLKKGDRVEVIGPSSGGDRGFVGLKGPITDTPFEARPGMMAAMLGIPEWGSARLFPVTSLRLLPVLKAGDRVLVKATGKEEAILRVWHSEGVADVYELEDEFCDADELEPAPEPKRMPKAGEVWNGSGITEGPCVVMVPDTGALAGGVRVFHLGKSQQYWCNSEQFHRTCTYLAASLKDAAALGLL